MVMMSIYSRDKPSLDKYSSAWLSQEYQIGGNNNHDDQSSTAGPRWDCLNKCCRLLQIFCIGTAPIYPTRRTRHEILQYTTNLASSVNARGRIHNAFNAPLLNFTKKPDKEQSCTLEKCSTRGKKNTWQVVHHHLDRRAAHRLLHNNLIDSTEIRVLFFLNFAWAICHMAVLGCANFSQIVFQQLLFQSVNRASSTTPEQVCTSKTTSKITSNVTFTIFGKLMEDASKEEISQGSSVTKVSLLPFLIYQNILLPWWQNYKLSQQTHL